MNVGILTGASAASAPARQGVQADIVLPDAKQAGLTSPNGTGACVEVSISPQASVLLTIDMDSLAKKGYTEVGIDTDGKPGAEISIKVQPGAGTVAIDTGGATAQATNGVTGTQRKMADYLLQLLLDSMGLPPTAPNAQAPQLAADSETGPTTPERDPAELPSTPTSPLIQIALRTYNATAN